VFRWGTPGTETGHGWEADQSVDLTLNEDGNGNYAVFLRINLEQTRTTNDQNQTRTYKLQYRKDGGTWTNVTGSSSNVQAVADSPDNIADGAATTERLVGTNGYTFQSGEYDEGDGVCDAITWTATAQREAELLFSLQIVDADMADGAFLEFRVIESDDTLLNNSATADFPRLDWDSAALSPLAADPGAVTVTGTAATLAQGYAIAADPGLTPARWLLRERTQGWLALPECSRQIPARSLSPTLPTRRWSGQPTARPARSSSRAQTRHSQAHRSRSLRTLGRLSLLARTRP
jgi:hypothetical protein